MHQPDNVLEICQRTKENNPSGRSNFHIIACLSLTLRLVKIVRDGDLRELQAFLMSGSCPQVVNELDEKRLSPLHYAARLSRADMMEELLTHGADIGQAGEDGMTPLHFGAR